MRKGTFIILALAVCVISNTSASEKVPLAISPGHEIGVASVGEVCPTFSWTAVEVAKAYKVEVFEATSNDVLTYEDQASIACPILTKKIEGAATSWTPSSDERLSHGGTYVWYVQAVDELGVETWSEGRTFKVEVERWSSEMDLIVRETLQEKGISEDTITDILEDIKSRANEETAQETNSQNNIGFVPLTFRIQGTEGATYTFYGTGAGASHTTGLYNTFIGAYAGWSNTTAYGNTFMGYYAGASSTGEYNTFIGRMAGRNNTTAGYGTFVGTSAGYNTTTGAENTYLGTRAGLTNTTGYENTCLGFESGYLNSTGNGNICLGYKAGYNETTSDKLYIDNSDTTNPLIYGEFDNDILAVNGKFGVGTQSPGYPMHLQRTGGNAAFIADRTDGAINYINATATYGNFGTVNDYPLRMVVNAVWRMRLDSDDSLTMKNGATCTAGGVWTDASSRDLKENIQTLSTEEAMDVLDALNPVKYNYKVDKEEDCLGFIAEDVPDMVASKDRKGMSPMDVVAILTKVLQEQRETVKEHKKTINELQKRVDELEGKSQIQK